MFFPKQFGWAAILAGIGFLAFAAANSRRYSAVGLDTDRLRDEHIMHTYFRVRWLGDGSVRCGAGEKQYTLEEEEFTRIDLAGRLREEPQFDMHRPAEFGFGLWRNPEAYDSKEGKHLWARWVSVPDWLPGIVMLAIGTAFYNRSTKRGCGA
ncbi:MAG: hypothetical protein H8E66_16395 [Planctomycetes bacterium]|nr:hypothetical protein [Planctomycetota bacterium]